MSISKCNNLFIISFLLHFVFIFNLHSQIESNKIDEYNTYRTIFNNEVNNTHGIDSVPIGVPYQGPGYILPSWFLNLPKGNSDTTFSVGISDPYLPIVGRKSQAITRAIGLAALLRDTKINMMRDIYNSDYLSKTNSVYTSMFEELYILNQFDQEFLNWDTVSVDTTKYGEVIVLLKVFSQLDPNYFNSINSFRIEYFNTEYLRRNKYEVNRDVEMFQNLVGQNLSANEIQYSFTQINKVFDIKSVYKNIESSIKANYYKYNTSSDSLSININNDFGEVLYYGLWFGYISATLQTIKRELIPNEVLLDNVVEQYVDSYKDFSREKFVINTSFEIKDINVCNNKIYVDIINVKK